MHDLRFAFRQLLRNPGFTTMAAVTLALGIGANTLMFSLVNAVMLKPLPFRHPHELMQIYHSYPKLNFPKVSVSPIALCRYLEVVKSFESLAAYTGYRAPLNLTDGRRAERVNSTVVTANFFETLGVMPIRGAGFRPEHEMPGANHVLVLSHHLWQGRFGADPGIVGKAIRLDGTQYEVIGVMPSWFRFPDKVELWIPLALTPEQKNDGVEYLNVIGRLREGVTSERAAAEMDSIAEEIRRERGLRAEFWKVTTLPLDRELVGDMRPALLVLLGAVTCVLLIACANVANLLLARATARRKEIAIRAALGASRRRIVRLLLTEGVALSLIGGGLGALIGRWGLDVFLAMMPVDPPTFVRIAVDARVLAFTLAVSVGAGLLFAAFPAFAVSSTRVNETLKEGGRTSAASGRHPFRHALVVSELAMALVLLVGAGLLIRSFARLQMADHGYDPQNALIASVNLPRPKYDNPEKRVAFLEGLLRRVSALPGVETAGAVNALPYQVVASKSFVIEGKTELSPHAHYNPASPGYLKAMGLRLVRGRWFNDHDRAGAPLVVVLEQSVASAYFPSEDPIGKRIAYGANGAPPNPEWREIVGIVAPVKHGPALVQDKKGMVYLPMAQEPFMSNHLVVRTSTRPESLAPALRSVLGGMDAEQAFLDVKTVAELRNEHSAQSRFNMVLLAAFAGLALLLAAVGIYGVISCSVVQRTHEIGVRMALGAQRRDVLRMLLFQVIKLSALGLGLGMLGAFAATRLLSSMLFGVSPTDPATFAGILLLLAAIALLASYLPARRATAVDPTVALRQE